MNATRLSGRVALVTGAGRGIGKAIVLRFAHEGAKVVVNDIEAAFAENIADRLNREGKPSLAIRGDVSDWAEVNGMFERAVQEFGKIDILVNNAGIRRDAHFHEMSEKAWDAVMAVQLKGSFNCARAAQRYMIGQRYGRIVNIASPMPPALGGQGQVNYSVAGAGLKGFTQSLARELGAYNITVNCVSPDYIDTEMTRKAARSEGLYLNDLNRFAAAAIPLRRLGTPAEVANVVLFLASEESSFVSGQIVEVKGGP